MSLQITTGPTAELVTLAAVKARLRLTSTADDALITGQIPVARTFAEKITRRSLALKTYALFLDGFPPVYQPLRVPVPPLVQVTSIKYLDNTLTQQTWDPSEYFVAPSQSPGLIIPVSGFIYPSAARVPGSVEVDFTAGYTVTAEDGGAPITDQNAGIATEAISRLCVYLYQTPEASEVGMVKDDPLGAVSMLRSIKIYEF